MRRRLSEIWLDRLIERELTEGLSPRARTRLHQRLRGDEAARARYDRAVAALRMLEGDADIASLELPLVGRWLADEWEPEAEPARRAWPAVLTVLAAALLLLWVSPLSDPGSLRPWTEAHDGWQARGGARSSLALEALCGPADTPDPPLRVRDCKHQDLMGFAYRVPTSVRGELTLFGVDANGDAMYYLPTPVDPAGITVDPGHWRALRLAVRLWVNHAPGPLRIYGVVGPRVATPEEVEAWAQQLAPQPAASPGEQPWVERVDPSSLADLCPTPTSCPAAELSVDLRP